VLLREYISVICSAVKRVLHISVICSGVKRVLIHCRTLDFVLKEPLSAFFSALFIYQGQVFNIKFGLISLLYTTD